MRKRETRSVAKSGGFRVLFPLISRIVNLARVLHSCVFAKFVIRVFLRAPSTQIEDVNRSICGNIQMCTWIFITCAKILHLTAAKKQEQRKLRKQKLFKKKKTRKIHKANLVQF